MQKGRLSREGLKGIACVTMLLDHIGASLVSSVALRIIGRIAFPIYCFLLAEGACYTRNAKNYALRLGLVMVLSEIPFDLVIYGRLTLYKQNVLVTLLLGFGALMAMKQVEGLFKKLLLTLPFLAAAELLQTDYGAQGVAMAVLFGLVREYDLNLGLTALGLAAVSLMRPSIPVWGIPIELFSLAALIPIAFYSGKKGTDSRLVQWGFYFFYPLHLTVLAILQFG